MQKATLEGDYKTNNKEGKPILQIFKFLEKNKELASVTLPLLFTNRNIVTRTRAATHCLALNIFIEEAVKILEEAANNEQVGIFGFNAEMTLKVWHKQGYLKMYQEKK